MELKNFRQVNQFMGQFRPGTIGDKGVYTLERMERLMPIIGSPQEKVRVVHIAGTSGKTSTSYYISKLLSMTGTKVGLSVSPHIHEINERVQVNNEPLPEKEFCKLFNEFIAIEGVLELQPSYFELLVAFAYWSFNELGCKYAVMEVGLGGLIDGTNIVSSQSKVAVITDIGLDHTKILGETTDKIAYQKAGIIKPYNHVFSYYQDDVIEGVIQSACAKQYATLHSFRQSKLEEAEKLIDSLPAYQRRNWLLAKQVVDYIIQRDDLSDLAEPDLLKTQQIIVPGRMQKIVKNGKTIVLDGAHNPQKLAAFCSSLKQEYPTQNVRALISFSEAKQETLSESLDILRTITSDVITTEFTIMMDLPHHAVKSDVLAEMCRSTGFSHVISESDCHKALDILVSSEADLYVVTGSFYLISSLSYTLNT